MLHGTTFPGSSWWITFPLFSCFPNTGETHPKCDIGVMMVASGELGVSMYRILPQVLLPTECMYKLYPLFSPFACSCSPSRKHFSVKYPDDLPINLPNLLRFILQHSGSVDYTDKPLAASADAGASGPDAIFRAEFLALQHEVQILRHAREHLSQQLAQLWRNNRRLKLDTRSLEAQNAKLQQERESLEEQHREKSRQLVEAVRRLQELADTSENLLNENALLRVLLRALKDRAEAKDKVEEERKEREQQSSHTAS